MRLLLCTSMVVSGTALAQPAPASGGDAQASLLPRGLDPEQPAQLQQVLVAYADDLVARVARVREHIASLDSEALDDTRSDVVAVWMALDRIDRIGVLTRLPGTPGRAPRDDAGAIDGTEPARVTRGRLGDGPLVSEREPGASAVDPESVRAFIDTHIGDEVSSEFRDLLSDNQTIERVLSGRRGRDLLELMETVDTDPELGELKLAEFRSIVRVMHLMRSMRVARMNAASDASGTSDLNPMSTPEIASLHQQLGEAIRARFDAIAAIRRLELTRLRDRIAGIENDLARDETRRDQTIERLMRDHMEMLARPVRGPGRDGPPPPPGERTRD